MAKVNSEGSLYADIYTLIGVTRGDTNLGTFTGSTISDNTDLKDALQDLETAIEGLNTIYSSDGTLSGNRTVTLSSNTITFTGALGNTVIEADGGLSVSTAVKYTGETPSSPAAGTTWFDSNTKEMVLAVTGIGATEAVWTSQNAFSQIVGGTNGAGTSQNTALKMGGIYSSTKYSCVEEYDGNSWSAGTNLPAGRYRGASFGTFTSAIYTIGICNTPGCTTTYEWDGSSWTTGGAAIKGRWYGAGFGTQTAGATAGGYNSSPDFAIACVEEYNGTSWSSATAMSTLAWLLKGAGLQTAGIVPGGYCVAYCCVTQEYNGTSWSNGGNLITARGGMGVGGLQTAAFAATGTTGSNVTCNEEYNGTSWSAANPTITAGGEPGDSGPSSSAVIFGHGGCTTCTEEYTCVDYLPFRICYV